ncbi:hypothetical protein FV139_15675 [Parahaliea maris]|uniref:DUF3592 domain-containing protein n=1 Tax=Parahaliea maris TaxID=2716870 RepID=A0A5C8ZWM1_9GAMM|nr:hypothetical protein [Parahaliea maris]TXS92154.1 hypothetical protein FV139_15675 [Parahaliea maris]
MSDTCQPSQFPGFTQTLLCAVMLCAGVILLTGIAVPPETPSTTGPEAPGDLWMLSGLGLLFLLAGVILLIPLLHRTGRALAERRWQRQFPGQPWRWRGAWQEGRLGHDAAEQLYRASLLPVGFTIASLLLTALAITVIGGNGESTVFETLLGLAGLAAFIGVAVWGWRQFLRAWALYTWGRGSYFTLDDFPASPGERLMGTVAVPGGELDRVTAYRVTLVREEWKRSEGGGSGKQLVRSTEWESQPVTDPSVQDGGLSIEQPLPRGRQESNWGNRKRAYRWLLELQLGETGELCYEFPCFRQPR